MHGQDTLYTLQFQNHVGNMFVGITSLQHYLTLQVLHHSLLVNGQYMHRTQIQLATSSGTSEGAGTAILTFLGGFHPQTESLWLTDMAHHHLAIAVVFILAGHQYRTNFGIGHSMREILEAHTPPGGGLGAGHKGLFDTVNNSLHFQLGLALASVGVITSLVAQHACSLPAYAFLAQTLQLKQHFMHTTVHCWIHYVWSVCSRNNLLYP